MELGNEVVINIASIWDQKNAVWVDAVVTGVHDTHFFARPRQGGKKVKMFFAHQGQTWLNSLTEEDYA